jgi:hypothetical protein
LIPLLDAAGRGDPQLHDLLRQYSRILVIDNPLHPVFDRKRLGSYLVLQKETAQGDLSVLYCTPN